MTQQLVFTLISIISPLKVGRERFISCTLNSRPSAIEILLTYLPPFSPDLNPIEKAWSKLKQALRATQARTVDALHNAVANLLPTLSANDPRAWFRLRCGEL